MISDRADRDKPRWHRPRRQGRHHQRRWRQRLGSLARLRRTTPLEPRAPETRQLTRLKISPAEMKVISSIVGGDDAAKDKAFADGLYVKGDRFVMARAEDRSIYARSVRPLHLT